ncbi:glycoside hydrolase family 32 protein [Microbacterium sp. NPDC057944]|uniref:glycoside hydrolase family 32 protein n=1 Tax=Microbacterium sp. NPDC057944 TaxID=3346286 RepID=UPI0036DEC8A0
MSPTTEENDITTTAAAVRRPRLHFTPERNWMNDPNGLVFHNGLYHLYFQHNPHGNDHAHMSWGHATSPDLLEWTEQPVAIPHGDDGDIFSGSIVVDAGNTSGFGTLENPPLVAVYTLADLTAGRQSQAIAYSLDGGFTWTAYEGNPVYDRGTSDFRDPKVFRYEGAAGSYWVMVAVEARDRQVLLARSDDLREWTPLSVFGPSGAVDGVWECPDLFPLAVDGDPEDVRWVLLVSLNPGGIAGGSGTQCFIGSFDGVEFRADAPLAPLPASGLAQSVWLDRGRDCYAGVTFSGLPPHDRVLIAWMSNWDYAAQVPSSPWRGSMTLPRRLDLVTADGHPVLRQTPIVAAGVPATGDELPTACRITVQVRVGDEGGFRLRLRTDAAGEGGVVVTADAVERRLVVDRTAAGSFHPLFPSVESTPLRIDGGVIGLDIWLDTSSIEVFADGGRTTVTDLFLFEEDARRLILETWGDGAVVERLSVERIGADA